MDPGRRRTSVLKSAKGVFSEKGFHDASVSDIIEAAGIARGTFYLYFKNKRDLFDSLLDRLLEDLFSLIHRVTLEPGDPDPVDQIRANLRRVLELFLDDVDLTRIVLHHAVGLDHEFDRKLTDFNDRVSEMLAQSLSLGIEMGLIRTCEVHVVAHLILGGVKEVVWRLVSRPGREPVPALDVLVDEILAFGMRGVAAGAVTRKEESPLSAPRTP